MKRHALFVGVDQYADGHIPNLSCAVSDATDLHGFFKYGAGYDQVELLPNPSSKKEVLGKVRSLTSGLGPGDFFLFFFAGHGFRVGENHVLVCSNDLYDDVKYEDDGLPLGQLKRRLSGAFNSALLLDACQSDILATRGGEGIAERDLSLIHEAPSVMAGGGALTVVTSCDAGQTAAELSERRHGLFTVAMLDLLREAQRAHSRIDLSDAFRVSLGQRMGEIAARFGLPTEQRPRFSCTGDSCFVLLDGDVPMASASQPQPQYHQPGAVPTLVVCSMCGKKNHPEDTFKCRKCGCDNLCLRHQDEETFLCAACAAEQRKAREEAERKAEAERKIREEAERKAHEEMERRQSNQVVCPACGSRNLSAYTFTCRVCGKKHLCQSHYDAAENCCAECAAARRKSREEALRTAREEVRRKAREAEEKARLAVLPKTDDVKTLPLPGGAEMELVWCPPGEFMMGSPANEEGRFDEETQHRVRLTKGFWLGKYPVTQRQWQSVMGGNPSSCKGGDLPVEMVSWDDCQAFIKKVNAALGCGARLPTEAEWEYACRAGTTTAYFWGNALNGDRANSDGREPCGTKTKGAYLGKTTPVGKYGANPWGLCDMHGNVWEWCADWYGDYSGDAIDPTGPASGVYRVLRGGCWIRNARFCRSAYRFGLRPGLRFNFYGFRLCCSTVPRGQEVEP